MHPSEIKPPPYQVEITVSGRKLSRSARVQTAKEMRNNTVYIIRRAIDALPDKLKKRVDFIIRSV